MNGFNSAIAMSQEPPKSSGVIFGRFMLPDMSEHACQVSDLTEVGASFLTQDVAPKGQPIVAYLEEVGRVECISSDPVQGGFGVKFSLTGPRLERLQQRIQWLKQRQSGELPDGRRHARYEPTEKVSQIALPDGRIYPCEVIDISLSGAAIKTEVMPSVGTFLMLGKMRGRVVRYLDQGVAIEFVKQLDRSTLPHTAGASL
ncbi:MAG: PilZ domain-containing protein [Alphaproteobacteria bacterium]|nr:PilZ domain-containing protein [Alphaproteobacteria bacterium]